MATGSKNTAATSMGICTFCKSEVSKNKMTQHLKFCKQRIADIAAEEKKSQKKKTRLFHILAEGQYNPQYWLHFEIPVTESLWSLDSFLKDMWIDDLDHLSGFTINGTNYGNDYPDDFFSFGEVEEDSEEEELSEEEKEAEVRRFIDATLANYAEMLTAFINTPITTDSFLTEWVEEIKKPRSIDELVDFLKEELARITKEEKQLRIHTEEVSPTEQRKR